ncbi:MAG TPA: chemotaxis protein CheB [Chloroflexota bacterium]|nr:chemotaxis protein CheB [Chloroflexota bacterium]
MRTRLITIGASLGGFSALKVVLRGLRPEFLVPVAIVQHQGAASASDLPGLLQRYCPLPVREPYDKEPIAPGNVYVAPAGYHLLVENGAFALTTEGPVLYARPSIDVLFESAAKGYGSGVIGVALTSSSEDGVLGLLAIQRRGGLVVVQDPATAEGRVLPDAALAALSPDAVLPPFKIAPYLALLCSFSTNQENAMRARRAS